MKLSFSLDGHLPVDTYGNPDRTDVEYRSIWEAAGLAQVMRLVEIVASACWTGSDLSYQTPENGSLVIRNQDGADLVRLAVQRDRQRGSDLLQVQIDTMGKLPDNAKLGNLLVARVITGLVTSDAEAWASARMRALADRMALPERYRNTDDLSSVAGLQEHLARWHGTETSGEYDELVSKHDEYHRNALAIGWDHENEHVH